MGIDMGLKNRFGTVLGSNWNLYNMSPLFAPFFPMAYIITGRRAPYVGRRGLLGPPGGGEVPVRTHPSLEVDIGLSMLPPHRDPRVHLL